jgi:hypothetical protein
MKSIKHSFKNTFEIELKDKKKIFKYYANEIFKSRQIIGFTGSLSIPDYELNTVDQQD